MRIGLHALGIGAGAHRAVIDAVATTAEQRGFSTLWVGEHVVMVDDMSSRYPYAADGRIAVEATADWLDPMICLSFVAAATSTITIATGVLLLPEHNPVVIAKKAASLDRLSGGRFVLGVGVGWSSEEFAALGVPFARRGSRTTEYAAAMRTIWSDEVASFEGQFIRFEGIRVNPKPVSGGAIPIVLGGNSDAALRRVARWADGWYGFNLDGTAEVAQRIDYLEECCRAAGRRAADLDLVVALQDPRPEDIPVLAELGVDELVLVEGPPADPQEATAWVNDLADRWIPELP